MSDIKGLGFNLRDLDALKKQAAQQGVNGENFGNKNEGVTNIFAEENKANEMTAGSTDFSEDIPEISEEDINALENGEEIESEKKETEEKSALKSMADAVQNLMGSLFQSSGSGYPKAANVIAGTKIVGLNTDLNKLFISENATVSELEKMKKETLHDYENDINNKKAEKEQFIASQESKKSSITSQINSQKTEIQNVKNEISDKESDISKTESEISSVETLISSLKSALSSINSEDENAAAKKSAIEAKIQELEAKKSELEEKKTNLESEKSELEQKLSGAEQQLTKLETELKNVEAETTKNVQIFEQEISSLEHTKNSEISKLDLKIAQAKANENSGKTDKEKEQTNIFVVA